MAGLTMAPIECQFITDSESLDGVDLPVSKGWNHTSLLSVEGNIVALWRQINVPTHRRPHKRKGQIERIQRVRIASTAESWGKTRSMFSILLLPQHTGLVPPSSHTNGIKACFSLATPLT